MFYFFSHDNLAGCRVPCEIVNLALPFTFHASWIPREEIIKQWLFVAIPRLVSGKKSYPAYLKKLLT